MIYTPDTKKAIRLCFEAHKDQTDKSGLPYVFHPFHVAEQMTDEKTTVTALLHDVIEDTDYTIEDLRQMGFEENVLEALSLMTHDKNTPYLAYVRKIKGNPIARQVKLADLKHNSDLTRLDVIDEKSLARVEKYREAIRILTEEEWNNTGRAESTQVTVREYGEKDLGSMISIWNEIVEEGIAFPQEDFLDGETGKAFFASQSSCGVAEIGGQVLGLYILHPNNIGRCGHICNASYAVSSKARGQGLGEKLVLDSLRKGKKLGFSVMQFNAVVESNLRARHLYERLGFQPLGIIPDGFRMKDGHYENICPYYFELKNI